MVARKSFSKFQQSEIVGSQDGKCKICSTRFSKDVHPQFDHVNGDNSDNSTKNGQAICSNCHDAKSRKENVKRSMAKQNIDFVKFCPFCKHELKGKDYRDEKSGIKIETKHLPADEWHTCGGCNSRFKVIRYDARNKKKSSAKKHDGVVRYCVNCRVEFDQKLSSNMAFKCAECDTGFSVWIKEYKKKGWLS